MQLTWRQCNLIITSGKGAPYTTIRLLMLLLLVAITPYHVTIALPEGTFPVAKRMNIETCLVRFDVHLNTIIRTEESRSMGARFLDDADLNSREQCLRLCCETENCDVFVFEEKSPGTCFLFQCGPPENFRCKFTRHSNYTSAVLSIPPPPIEQPPPPPPLAVQIQALAAQPAATANGVTKSLSQHEMELVSLKDGGTSKQLGGANFATPLSSTTPLPPLGVRLGEIQTTPNPSTAKQQSLSSQQCGHFEFPCHSGECIAVYNVCDGIPQCEDGSDEGAECPQKNSGSSATVEGARKQVPGLGRPSSLSGGGSVNQPIIMIPGVHGGMGGGAGGENMSPMGMNAPGMLPLDQRMYQPMEYQQPSNRFSLSSLEQQQQQQMHRNREDPMTAPKPWPRPAINEPNYVDTSDSHIFNHKGGLQISAVNNMIPPGQQYQESLPESSYMPSSSVIRPGGGKSYLTLSSSNSYPQQALQQFPAEQSPQQQPPYKSILPSQWKVSNSNIRSSWPIQPGDELSPNSGGGSDGVSPREQYIQPPVQQQQQQQHSIATQVIQSTSNGAAGDGSMFSSIVLQQQPVQNPSLPAGAGPQWTQAAAAAGTPTPDTSSTRDGAANQALGADTSIKDPSTSSHESKPSGAAAAAAGVPQNGAKHKPLSSNVPSDGDAEYEEDTYEDTYPESTNAGTSRADNQSQPTTQTEPPKKKFRKHRKHDHDHGKQDNSENAGEPSEQKKKKKMKTIKKDKSTEHEAGGHHVDPIVHEHLKALHKDLEIEFADHDGYADRPGGAMLSLTLGVLLTAAMGILLSCRMRVARRRIRRPGKSSYAHDADFLVNGMYL
ncbi:uncharacterized protein LOC126564109 [Anopheles maculipalpis]|uniref:uncharacterized protein LOC126564109 n=1 Tax=Anopheles maculipalpis TaxID=1496333 RepID=UPI00215961A9|nr:uncharacterized protein LOC126564109 [Anopheles maculipalpis]